MVISETANIAEPTHNMLVKPKANKGKTSLKALLPALFYYLDLGIQVRKGEGKTV